MISYVRLIPDTVYAVAIGCAECYIISHLSPVSGAMLIQWVIAAHVHSITPFTQECVVVCKSVILIPQTNFNTALVNLIGH